MLRICPCAMNVYRCMLMAMTVERFLHTQVCRLEDYTAAASQYLCTFIA